MANPEHLRILKQGVEAWNKWRQDGNFFSADLSGANLSGANLISAHLIIADLSGANLIGADLSGAHLGGAHLQSANLHAAHLRAAHLTGADLSGADLGLADLTGAQVNDADLSGASLQGAILRHAILDNTSVAEARIGRTIFAFLSLKTAKGLETCKHAGPSALDYHTLRESGPLPEVFLRGCGLPNEFIHYLPSFWNQPIQYWTVVPSCRVFQFKQINVGAVAETNFGGEEFLEDGAFG